METTVVARLREAAELASEKGVRLDVNVNGIQAGKMLPINGRYYTSSNFTPWGAIERGGKNPLIGAIEMLMKQFEEFAA